MGLVILIRLAPYRLAFLDAGEDRVMANLCKVLTLPQRLLRRRIMMWVCQRAFWLGQYCQVHHLPRRSMGHETGVRLCLTLLSINTIDHLPLQVIIDDRKRCI